MWFFVFIFAFFLICQTFIASWWAIHNFNKLKEQRWTINTSIIFVLAVLWAFLGEFHGVLLLATLEYYSFQS